MCYVSNRRVYALSRIYNSHIPNMVIIHDAHQPCGLLTSVPVAHYINIMILIIGAHNVTLDLWSMLHNMWLMYTTYVQHAHNQQSVQLLMQDLTNLTDLCAKVDFFDFSTFCSKLVKSCINSWTDLQVDLSELIVAHHVYVNPNFHSHSCFIQ